jgi:hypothetical protein
MKSEQFKSVYIAGPMRGYPDYNFPAFDKAKELAYANDFHIVYSPADMDRIDGHEISKLSNKERQRVYARRDVDAIFLCTHIAMLPGWEKSIGARTEYALAVWLGLEILDATNFLPLCEYNYNIVPLNRELTNA